MCYFASASTKNLAYNSGRADLAVKSGKSGKIGAETVKNGNPAANKSGGVVKAYNEQKLDNTQRSKLRVLDIYSKSKGIKIYVVDDIRSQIRDKNGNTVKVNGKSVNGKSTAVISLKDGAKIYSKVAGHTLFSFSEEFSPEQTKALRDFVIGELKSDSGYNFDSEVLRYGKINNTTDLNIIYSQMAADLCFDVLNDSAAWNKLINTNKPLAKNLAMWYKQYAADITASVKKQFGSSNGQLAKASFKEAAAISETAGKWNDAVDGGSGNNNDFGEEKKPYNDEITEGVGSKIDNIEIIDGKVGGKIPVDDFNVIRKSSVKNSNADSITLGKYTNDSNSYIAKAGKDSSYFDLGSDWGKIQNKYNLSDAEMFEYFNKPALNDAISGGKSIRFSHNPRLYEKGFLVDEWEYIKSIKGLNDSNLIFEGGFWIVK